MQLTVCSKFTSLYNHSCIYAIVYMPPNYRTFLSLPKEFLYTIVITLYLPLYQDPATTNLCLYGFAILNISYKFSSILCGLSCLSSFTQHNVFKDSAMLQQILVFYSFLWVYSIPLCGYTIFFIDSSVFELWIISNSWDIKNSSMNICVYKFLDKHVFRSFEYIPRSRFVGSCANSV